MPFVQNAPGERQMPERKRKWTIVAITFAAAWLGAAYVSGQPPWAGLPLAMLGTAYGAYALCNIVFTIPKMKLIKEMQPCRQHYRWVMSHNMRWFLRFMSVILPVGPALLLNIIMAEPATTAQHCLAIAIFTACVAIPVTLLQCRDTEEQYRIHQSDYCPDNLIHDDDNVVPGYASDPQRRNRNETFLPDTIN